MGSPVYRENYLAALEVAHSNLDQIMQDFESLQHRKSQLENAVGALKPFLAFAQPGHMPQAEPTAYQSREAEPAQSPAEPAHRDAQVSVPEQSAPAAFAPRSESILDPIQSRINRALGLAVA